MEAAKDELDLEIAEGLQKKLKKKKKKKKKTKKKKFTAKKALEAGGKMKVNSVTLKNLF